MAYKKQCDSCFKEVDEPNVPYLQIHGSVSEQVTDESRNIEYRYLTPHPNYRLAFCTPECLQDWIQAMRLENVFVPRQRNTYPQQ